MSYLDRLNEGPPRPPIDRPPTAEQVQQMLEWAQAFNAMLGTLGVSQTGFGSAILRAPVRFTVTVSSNPTALDTSGPIIAVTGVSGLNANAMILRPGGNPGPGECAVVYDADQRPLLFFDASDSITSATVHQLQIPTVFVQAIRSGP